MYIPLYQLKENEIFNYTYHFDGWESENKNSCYRIAILMKKISYENKFDRNYFTI